MPKKTRASRTVRPSVTVVAVEGGFKVEGHFHQDLRLAMVDAQALLLDKLAKLHARPEAATQA